MTPRRRFGPRAAAATLTAVAAACALAACSGESGMRCEDQGRYAASTSAPPVRVPEGLSVPNESEALQIPPGDDDASDDETSTRCLERPPDYFEGGTPQGAE